MRDLLKGNVGRSLQALSAADRLAAAWPIACGAAMARRGEIVGYSDDIVTVNVQDVVWLDQMRSMRAVLMHELARIAGAPVAGIHFEVRAARPERVR